MRNWPLLVLILLFAGIVPAMADKQYPATIVSPPGSPVALTSCEAWARDWNKTVLIAHAAIGNRLFDLGVAFTNHSSKPVSAVRVMTTSYDSSNAVLGTASLDTASNQAANEMNLAPGSSLDLLGPRSWHGRNDNPNRDHVTCEVTTVTFADGTTWTAPTPAPMSSH